MRHVILVKHSLSAPLPAVTAEHWLLSAEGRRRCAALADRLAAYQPFTIIASIEPKALETAQIVAERLGLSASTMEGLHEHDRSNVAWSSTDVFEAAVARFFAQPSALVLGRETADQARERFTQAVERAIESCPSGNLAIVAHGTVISLFVAARSGLEPLPLWRRLGLPSFIALSLPDMMVSEIAEQIL